MDTKRDALSMKMCFVLMSFLFGSCTFPWNKSEIKTEKIPYQTDNAGINFIHLETDAWPGDSERIFARDDWAYIRSTFESAWDNAGSLLQMQFERLLGPASSGIKLESMELFSRNTIKIDSFEVGIDTRDKSEMPIRNGGRVTFSGGASEVLANAKFNFGAGKPYAIVSMNQPFRYVKLKPGFEFNLDAGDVLANVIAFPGAGKASEFLGGMLGVTAFRAQGRVQGISRFIMGEERRFNGPHGLYSAFEYHLAQQMFAKLCQVVKEREGISAEEREKSCAPIVNPKGELVEELAQAHNTMKVAKCEPRLSNGQIAIENANYLYNLYFLAPEIGKFNIDLLRPGRQLRVYKPEGELYAKVGAYGTVEDPALAADKCEIIDSNSRCISLRMGRAMLTNNRKQLDQECAAMANNYIVSFKKENTFKK